MGSDVPDWMLRRQAKLKLTPAAIERLEALSEELGVSHGMACDLAIRAVEDFDELVRAAQRVRADDKRVVSAWRRE